MLLRLLQGTALRRTEAPREARFSRTMLDELASSPEFIFRLVMPSDRRLQRLVELLYADPAQRLSLRDWGERIGASDRTLSRLFQVETGMSFGTWHRHFQMSLALKWLAARHPVTRIDTALGYQHSSAFIAMFQRIVRRNPTQYASSLPAVGFDSENEQG
ncbi:helix-turn-helix transcriptional regulator [Paraburkholderia sediminicola]|uniref:helix-turn-helix transcriptional regulator n=1 Tax=Paraburkholderia sediminicola TaxID=458836 RepID=UPI0038BD8E01